LSLTHRKLPPFKSLTYFESAARLQSFTRASVELNVTQGAVSRQIRLLEKFLSRDLFLRQNRQVVLTDDGHNYFVSISHLLNQLQSATEALVQPVSDGNVTVITSGALASMYLLPRIPTFRQQYKEIQIRLVAKDNIGEIGKSEYDLAIFYSRKLPVDCQWSELFDEKIFPVCSPQYLENNQAQFSTDPDFSKNLIWLESEEDWINWPEWLDATGLNVRSFENRLVVNNYPMVIQAAIAGQGVALAWSCLVDEQIEQGLLVRPTDYHLETGAHFYLIAPKNRQMNSNSKLFYNWLLHN
jgi:LysR family glycine cleavage system transcriptional activator